MSKEDLALGRRLDSGYARSSMALPSAGIRTAFQVGEVHSLVEVVSSSLQESDLRRWGIHFAEGAAVEVSACLQAFASG